jgi:Uma2 family endonuclease
MNVPIRVSLWPPYDPEYPDSDGKPMADNTKQFCWIVTIQGNLDALFGDNPNVLVVGDLLWYPVRGHPEISTAPDVYTIFGRPKGERRSYKQWEEGGIAPQVVFEILSPNNTRQEMDDKLAFYDRYGVEEYYLYDPDGVRWSGWRRVRGRLRAIRKMDGWVSPRLGIRFDLSGKEPVIYHPDGRRFLTFNELVRQQQAAEKEKAKAEKEKAKAEREKGKAEKRARDAEERALRLAERLRELGIDPDA